MTVKELIDVSPFCDGVEVVVRDHGRWVQGYRVGKDAKIYPVNLNPKVMQRFGVESYHKTIFLKEDDEVDCEQGRGLPMKVICKDVRKIPDYIGNLIVNDVQPRNIPQIHGEALTHNDFLYDICVYPEGYVPEKEVKEKKPDDWSLDGQMTIEEWMS